MQFISVTNPMMLRMLANDPEVISLQTRVAQPNGHKFKVGEIRTLHGMESFPEFNGKQVEITAIREDGVHGKAYYIKSDIDHIINWVYEYRLK